eukprot:4229353-Pyramimonas_sp.AAC.1
MVADGFKVSLNQVSCETCVIDCLNFTLGGGEDLSIHPDDIFGGNSAAPRNETTDTRGESTGPRGELTGPAGKFTPRRQMVTGIAYGMGVTCHAHYRSVKHNPRHHEERLRCERAYGVHVLGSTLDLTRGVLDASVLT